MPNTLREDLDDAEGKTEHVIVVVADVRGFSAFSKRHDSLDVAMYIKRVYIQLIDDYFPFASFYKATGDGLLMTVRFNDRNLAKWARNTVAAALRCVAEFPNICKNDSMINFAVPENIGFGIARGPACGLVSKNEMLDYSGRILNLTSRLMDLARPSGIVLDRTLGFKLLPDKQQKRFKAERVSIRSFTGAKLRRVYVTNSVVLSDQAKRPLISERFIIDKAKTVAQWNKLAPRYRVALPTGIRHPDRINTELRHAIRNLGVHRNHKFRDFEYEHDAGAARVAIDTNKVVEYARAKRLSGPTKLTVRISYVAE